MSSNEDQFSISTPSLSDLESNEESGNILADRHNDGVDDIDLSPVYANSDDAGDGTLSVEEMSHESGDEVFNGSDLGDAAMSPAQYNSQNSSFSHDTLKNREGPSVKIFEPIQKIEEKPPMEIVSNTRLGVKIKRLKIAGEWKWVDGKGDNCGICRTSFETCCVDCKFPGDECPLVLGVCKHPFHFHCIVKWTNAQSGQQKPACPLCRQEWKFLS